MAVSTRHLLHESLRRNSQKAADDFQECPPPRPRSHVSNNKSLSQQHQQKKRIGAQSTTVLAALSNQDSELAKFLFVEIEKKGEAEEECRNAGGINTGGSSDGKITSMGTLKAPWYSLALEPMDVRSVRIIMLGEAFAIFGALFLNGTWILYEWGSAKSYGSSDNEAVNRVFEAVMAIAITSNTFLALSGSLLWMLSVTNSGSDHGWVYTVRNLLSFCQLLMLLTIFVDVIGLLIGIYSNLFPRWPETIVTLSIGVFMFLIYYQLTASTLSTKSLEFYHFPLFYKIMINPKAVLTKEGREKMESNAKAEAEELKKRAYHERKTLDPIFQEDTNQGASSVGILLRNAAIRLGKNEHDTYLYEARLGEDWFEEAQQLKGMSVDFLSRYMPWRLANEVHIELRNQGGVDE